jgi:hypothetical protein
VVVTSFAMLASKSSGQWEAGGQRRNNLVQGCFLYFNFLCLLKKSKEN